MIILPSAKTINRVRIELSLTFDDIDHDKVMIKGWRFNDNEKVKGILFQRNENSYTDDKIKEALISCAHLDYLYKYEKQV